MANAGYTHTLREQSVPELLYKAELVEQVMAMPGWAVIESAVNEHARRMLDQLLNGTTRPEEITRLRGLILGLGSMRDAAQAILDYAQERRSEAKLEEERV